MSTAELRELRREARVEASLFALIAGGLLWLLAVVSMAVGWELLGVSGWIWFILSLPELLLASVFALRAPRPVDFVALLLVVVGNLCGLGLLIASLVTEASSKLSGGQLDRKSTRLNSSHLGISY